MAALFELEELVVEIDRRSIIDVPHLVIPDSGITVVAGPSGSGKSTLLRLCNRLEVPTRGVIRFRGSDISSLDPLAHRRRVGMVFQRPAPFPGTVRDNLEVAAHSARGATSEGPALDDSAFGELLDRVGLDASFLDRLADDLSGGEAQRMCLARTLVTRPEVLLLDEPTSALDPHAAHLLERRARQVADDGMPIVWVSHDLDQVQRLADELVVLVAGRLATPEERSAFLAAELDDVAGPDDVVGESDAEGRPA